MADDPARDLARLRTQASKLRDAMASGILTVEGADGTGRVTYRSYAEMRLALGDLNQQINALDAQVGGVTRRRTRQVVMTGRSGW
ncbi:phage head-tail joining protein [Methylorubrum extorquens]|uniref:Uncharacterized protein n=1 Tax=Methylorubrum extorquens (strain CM4 / NCIMB 13688) TaxID=440085 RepID=B7KYU5_METC4|nr:hypothetical protein [Methylorubrum extorquens]ACK81218.1 hypothetical protein Mchl_0280 [Methylorubrum extorquens CM4]